MLPKKKKQFLIAGIIALFGLVLMLYDSELWSSKLLHSDEAVYIERVRRLSWNDLDPYHHGHFPYPSLYVYLVFLISKLIAFLSMNAGVSGLYFVGRALSCLFSAATIAVTYYYGLLLKDRSSAVCAALLLAVNTFYIQFSRYAILESTLTFFVVMASYLAAKQNSGLASWRPAAIAAALAVSTKFNGIFALAPLFTSLGLNNEARSRQPSYQAWLMYFAICGSLTLLGISGFFIVTPSRLNAFAISQVSDGFLERFYIDFFNSTPRLWLLVSGCGFLLLLLGVFRYRVAVYMINFFSQRELWLSLFLVVLIFFIISPYMIVNSKEIARSLIYEYRHLKAPETIRDAATGINNFSWFRSVWLWVRSVSVYISLLGASFGFAAGILALFGAIVFLKSKFQTALVVFSFPFVYILILGGIQYTAERYGLPLVPFACLLSAIGFIRLWELLSGPLLGRARALKG